ncbi:hairy-related 8.2 isoform X1 [Electrophorus electricus]|uniref:hairy-related 8.2 isoform X1 n=1 Tax=Electrophorus electricus TaxID=8005 RepID=UPI0015CFF89A|nr:hairy-related 8.2 isoform X1 [Electrophorus electricus]
MTATNFSQDTERHPNAKEERKLRKPLIERKRRERINHCLDQLRETVVGVFRLDQSKLEKADILEMTVKHLQNIQRNKVSAEPILDSEAQQRYSTGYIQCMHEVHNLLLSCDWMDKTLGSRLLNHLLKSLPRAATDGSQHPKPCFTSGPYSHSDHVCIHVNEVDSLRSCPASPAMGTRAAPPIKNHGTPPMSRPHPTESPHLTTLEMWRPW